MPKPVLQAMVLADHVYQDRVTGKFVIAGTFGVIGIQQRELGGVEAAPAGSEISGERRNITGIAHAGSPYLYVALTEVHGRVPLRLRYVNLADSGVIIEGEVELTSPDPVSVAEYAFQMPPLPVIVGSYSLDLLYEGELLGSWRVTVASRDAS